MDPDSSLDVRVQDERQWAQPEIKAIPFIHKGKFAYYESD